MTIERTEADIRQTKDFLAKAAANPHAHACAHRDNHDVCECECGAWAFNTMGESDWVEAGRVEALRREREAERQARKVAERMAPKPLDPRNQWTLP